MSGLSDNPLVALVQWRCGRRPSVSPGWWVLLLGGGALAAPLLGPGPWRAASWLLLACVYPLSVACSQAAVWASLRQGRGLEDLLASPASPAVLVDGLARHGAITVARSGLWLGPLWVLWGLALGQLPLAAALALALPGLALQALLAWLGSYVAQAGFAWSRGEDDLALRHLLAWPVLAPGLALALAHPLAALPGALLIALGARWLCLAGLSGYPRLTEGLRRLRERLLGLRQARSTPESAAAFEANPIVFRESRAEARSVPGGLAGLLLWRHGTALTFLAAMILLCQAGLRGNWEGTYGLVWGLLVTLLVLQTMRAAYRTVGSVVDERQEGTLEPLVQTPLSAVEWVDGWAATGWVPRTLENLAAAVALVCLALTAGMSAERVAMCCLLLLSFTVAASYTGICVSAASASRHEALDRAGVSLAGGLWVGGLLSLLAALAGPSALVPAALLSPVLAVAFRQRALNMVTCQGLLLAGPGLGLGGLSRAVRGLPRADLEARLRRSLRQEAPGGFARRLMERLEEGR